MKRILSGSVMLKLVNVINSDKTIGMSVKSKKPMIQGVMKLSRPDLANMARQGAVFSLGLLDAT